MVSKPGLFRVRPGDPHDIPAPLLPARIPPPVRVGGGICRCAGRGGRTGPKSGPGRAVAQRWRWRCAGLGGPARLPGCTRCGGFRCTSVARGWGAVGCRGVRRAVSGALRERRLLCCSDRHRNKPGEVARVSDRVVETLPVSFSRISGISRGTKQSWVILLNSGTPSGGHLLFSSKIIVSIREGGGKVFIVILLLLECSR